MEVPPIIDPGRGAPPYASFQNAPEPPRLPGWVFPAIIGSAVAGMVLGGLIVSTSETKRSVMPVAHFGEYHRSTTTADGWARYEFPDLGMSSELPREPIARWTTFKRPSSLQRVAGWAWYSLQSHLLYVDIYAWRGVPGYRTTLYQDGQDTVRGFSTHGYRAKNIKQEKAQIDGHEARRVECSYSNARGQESELVEYCFKQGDLSVFVRAVCWERDKVAGLASADRLFKSIRLSNPQP